MISDNATAVAVGTGRPRGPSGDAGAGPPTDPTDSATIGAGPSREGGDGSGGGRWVRIATASWAGLIVAAFAVGGLLRTVGALPVDPFPPLHAHPRLTLVPLLPAVAAGLAGVVAVPAAARRLAWRPLLAAAWLGSAVWAVALALPDGLSKPLTARTEYLAGLPAIGDHPLRWLRGFTRALPAYPTHVKGHPPLPTLILWALDHAGLRGPGWAAALVIAAGTSATVAIALTVRAVAGEDSARRAIPFLVLAPTALWIATSVDALFLGVGAWGVALAALAARAPRPVGALAVAFAGGLLLGALPYLSYGLLSFFVLPLAVLALTRPSRPVVVALAAGFVVVPAAFTVAGFSWWDGMIATHAAWAAGAGSRRPYAYFLFGDLAVLALLVGPATARALPRALVRAASFVRLAPPAPAGGNASGTPPAIAGTPAKPPGDAHRPAAVRPAERRAGFIRRGAQRLVCSWPGRLRLDRGDGGPRAGALGVLVAAALAGVVALDLSGVTRGEVERIWIPYAAWVLAANGVRRGPARTMVFAQVVTALVIEALVRSPW